jgi:glycerate 2-kinase
VIERALAEAVVRDAIAACDPARMVDFDAGDHEVVAVAVGKAAIAMARGLGPVTRGVVVVPEAAEVPPGWLLMIGAHPEPDERSAFAGRAVVEIVESARDGEILVALISGGASSMIEAPRLPLEELRAIVRAVMHAGIPIEKINLVRGALSSIKAGQLAARARVPIVTYAISDVIDDDLSVIGSGPTIGPWTTSPKVQVDYGAYLDLRRRQAISILQGVGISIPPVLDAPIASRFVVRDDVAFVRPMMMLADAADQAMRVRGLVAHVELDPIRDRVDAVADRLARATGLVIAWGEPVLRVPEDHGEGGRAQQLALELAKRLRGIDRSALVIGSDGIDGPPPRDRPAPAGAFVDGTTWDAIRARGLDPDAALARCDAGTALDAVGALVVTGPTGINHADLVIVG